MLSPSTFLDPCCGSGVYLTAAIKKLKSLGVRNWEKYINGYDIDNSAVICSKINCILEMEDNSHAELNIKCIDALIFDQQGMDKFDIIATNPPWGASYDNDTNSILLDKYLNIKSGESFSYFIDFAFKHLNKNGIFSFLLPESILSTGYHRDVRSLLISKEIEKISHLGKVFPGIISDVIKIDAINKDRNNATFSIVKGGVITDIDMEFILQSKDLSISINLDDITISKLKRIESSKNFYLKNNAIWALGIVTGNNKEHLKEKKTIGLEAIYTGKDVQKYILRPATAFIKFSKPSFQQCADESIFRNQEKLIYKFISKDLCFAYDNKSSLTLNSANIIIPKAKRGILYILAALNSNYASLFFHSKFNSIKILKGFIEQIPIPDMDDNSVNEIEDLVRCILRGENVNINIQKIDEKFNIYYGI
jgi:predicted RNA methylase